MRRLPALRKGLINDVATPAIGFGDAVMAPDPDATQTGECVKVDHMDPRATLLVIGVFNEGRNVNVVRVGTRVAEMTMWIAFGLACRTLSGDPR